MSLKKRLYAVSLLSLCTFFPAWQLVGQETRENKQEQKEAAIEQLVKSRQFRFVAQSATTMSGRSIQITYDYGIKFSKDTLQPYLPYYGRSYEASYASSEGGIEFTTQDFAYEMTNDKKGGWNLTFTPNNQRSANKITMYVTTAGYATVQVTSNTRQMISFYGYITPIR
jgi:hypothetical protein